MCWRCEATPVKYSLSITALMGDDRKDTNRIASIEGQLDANRQEVTVIQFQLDDKGKIVPESVNHVYTPLVQFGGKQ